MRQILLFAALAAVLALLLVSCGGTKDKPVPTEEDAPGKAAYHKISAEEAYETLDSPFTLSYGRCDFIVVAICFIPVSSRFAECPCNPKGAVL